MTDRTPARRVVVAGAGGRDFHDFATVLRDDPAVEVVAFTAAQIPGIDHRTFPAVLAGPRYPEGIPVYPEADLADLVARHGVDEVILSYSDLPHAEVMHRASIALAAGASFRLLAPQRSFLTLDRPVVAVTATRTGAGKSQTSRRIGRLLLDAGLRVALVRHPMPYGDLTAMAVQRFATLDELDAARPWP
jgi:predicted GTPase